VVKFAFVAVVCFLAFSRDKGVWVLAFNSSWDLLR